MEPLPCQDCPSDKWPGNSDLQDDLQIIAIRTQRFAQEVQSVSEQKLLFIVFSALDRPDSLMPFAERAEPASPSSRWGWKPEPGSVLSLT